MRFEPEKFTPDTGLYKGELCEGVRVVLTNRDALQTMRMGIEIAAALSCSIPTNLKPRRSSTMGNAERLSFFWRAVILRQ